MKIKTGDKVRLLVGKDKGKEGKVLQVFPRLGRIVVEGLNLSTKHLGRRGRDTKGQKITFPSPVQLSNVALVSGKSGKSGRVGYKMIQKEGATQKIRVLRTKSGEEDVE